MTQATTRETPSIAPRRTQIPEGLWLRCPGCGSMIYRKQMEANLSVCPECTHHFRIGAS
ncbi:MAG: acetyl-CoA carboxylase carboxyl transferase subunit beta, partial [Planctomycetota bacterium]